MEYKIGDIVSRYLSEGLSRESAVARIHREIGMGVWILTDRFMLTRGRQVSIS